MSNEIDFELVREWADMHANRLATNQTPYARAYLAQDAEIAKLRAKVAELEGALLGNEYMTGARLVAESADKHIASLRSRLAASQAECAVMREAMLGLHGGPIYIGRECHFGTHSAYELGHASKEAIERFNAALASSPNTAAHCARVEAMERVCEAAMRERDWIDTGNYTGEQWETNRATLADAISALRAQEKK